VDEIGFHAYAKPVRAAEFIRLGSNKSLDSKFMYLVLAREIASIADMDEVLNASTPVLTQVEINRVWAHGGWGVTLFNAPNRKFRVGILKGQAWSSELPLTESDMKTPKVFSIMHKAKEYMLCYKNTTLPGRFKRTQQLELMPRFAIVNLLHESISVRQDGVSNSFDTIAPFGAIAWHKADARREPMIQLKCYGTRWSFARIDVSEIGAHEIVLAGDETGHKRVLHVEVKVAEDTEECAVSVLVWRSALDESPTYVIENLSNACVCVRQTRAGIPADQQIHFAVDKGCKCVFGWSVLCEDKIIEVCVGDTFRDAASIVQVDFDVIGQPKPLKTPQSRKSLFVGVLPSGSSKALRITTSERLLIVDASTPEQRLDRMNRALMHFSVRLCAIDISFIGGACSLRWFSFFDALVLMQDVQDVSCSTGLLRG
jgi:hypothetical protein